MWLSFKQFLTSEAYQRDAYRWAVAHHVVALMTAVATAAWGPADLGLNWIWVFPAILVGIAFAVAFPTVMVGVWLGLLRSAHMTYEPNKAPVPADAVGWFFHVVMIFWMYGGLALGGLSTYLFVCWAGT